MKTIHLTHILILAAVMAGIAPAQNPPDNGNPNPPRAPVPAAPTDEDILPAIILDAVSAAISPETNGHQGPIVIEPGPSKTEKQIEPSAQFVPPAQPVGTNNPDSLKMNFKNAPLEMVLHYLSDAAGFIIVMDTRVNGNVSVISSQPISRNEAVDLLNSVLNKNGYAVIRNGRTLTIVDKNDVKSRGIPVKSGNNPDEIPNNAEIVTQIIPIRFVEARQLVSDLASFVSPQATVVANEAGNALVITDTQSNIKHLAEIIRAIDGSAEAGVEIRVFRLKHASPTDIASELASIFPNSNASSGQSPIRFGGRSGGPGGFFSQMMGGGAGGGSPSNDRVKKAMQVTAVADPRIQAVIVTAPKDLMEQIAGMMAELDVPSTRDQGVYVFKVNNGDPQQMVQVLQNMFQTGGARGAGSTTSSTLMKREQNNTSGTSSSGGSTGTGMGVGGSTGRTGGQF